MAKKKKSAEELRTEEIMREMEATRLKHQQAMVTAKDLVFAKLKEVGAAKVTFEYSGGGDSGQIDSVHASREDEGRQIDLADIILVAEVATQKQDKEGNWLHVVTTRGQSLADAAEELAYDYLVSLHGGWENNEGGFGTIVFDIPADKMRITHNEYIQDTNTSENEL